MPELATLESVRYTYPRAASPSLNNVNLTIDKGKFMVVMGATGAGKTTLALTLNGLIPQLLEGNLQGTVTVAGMETTRFRIQTLVQKIGLVLQDQETQIFGLTVRDDVAFGPANMELPPAEIEKRVQTALAAVGLGGYDDRFTSELSGGEKQRLGIAGVIAMAPELLVLDEPTSELDPQGREEVYALLEALRRDRDLTVVVVEHSTEEVVHRADEVVVLQDGEVRWRGAPRDLFRNVQQTRALGIRPPQMAELGWALKQRGLIREEEVPVTLAEAEALLAPRLAGQQEAAAAAPTSGPAPDSTTAPAPPPSPAAAPGATTAEPVIRIRNLVHDYGRVEALRGIDLTIHRGEFVALVGQNGAGKTTLVKHLNNLLRPTSGEVWIDGHSTRDLTTGELATMVGYVFQNPDHQIFAATVEEEVAYGLRHLNLSPEEKEARVARVLAFTDLERHRQRHPFTLGRGERQKLAVAAVLAMQPHILVIDEPTTGLDWLGAQRMLALIQDLHQAGHTILVITHDMEIVAEYAQRVVVMRRGQIIADGRPGAIFMQDEVLRQAHLTPPMVTQLARRLQWAGIPQDIITVRQAADALAPRLEE